MTVSYQKNSYRVRIAGREYALISEDPPEHIRRIADYVDRKIMETSATAFTNRESAAVFAGLAMAEELIYAQDDNARLRRELEQAQEELYHLKHE